MSIDLKSKITININSVAKEYDVAELLEIDENNLSTEFAQQAAVFGYFATAQAAAEDVAERRKIEKEREYAKADEYWRAWHDKREKKYTETVIRSTVIRDDDYIKAETYYNNAAHDANMLKLIVRALGQRADMLISLGAHLRAEMEMTGMNIRQKPDVAADAKEAISKRRQV